MNMWLMYLVLKLDNISGALIAFSVILGMVVIFGGLGLFALRDIHEDDEAFLKNILPKLFKIYKRVSIVTITIVCLAILVPTTKQMAAIYFVPKVINNKEVHKMPDKLVTLANSWMDEQIKSIKTK